MSTETETIARQLDIAVAALERFRDGGWGDLCSIDAQEALDAIEAAGAERGRTCPYGHRTETKEN